jgi:hypothetical protein
MANISVGAHVVAVVLALLQCGLASVLAYRLYLLSRTYKGADPHRRTTTVFMLKVHRICVFIMTTLQCVRCIDPFTAVGIWPYALNRFLQLAITITIYFMYSTTTYVVMDTLYACALKRTPRWLAVVVCILPASEFVVGFSMMTCHYIINRQWVGAVISFYCVLMFTVNLIAYNASGFYLIRILRNHQVTGVSNTPSEDISGSKSASPFDVVIGKTLRSMTILTLPSLAALLMFLILGIQSANNNPMPVFNAVDLAWGTLATLFIQLVLGLLFTRVAWISKTALEAEIIGKANSTPSTGSAAVSSEGSPEKRRAASRADMKDKVTRMSQSPKPRFSEGAQNSHPESDLQQGPLDGPTPMIVVETEVPTKVEVVVV